MVEVPGAYQDLLSDELKAFSILGTLMKDGTPQVTPIWFNVENGYFFVNSSRDRLKTQNMSMRPEVALTVIDPRNPYRYLQIRGKVVEITEEGAVELINRLSQKYRGRPFEVPPGQVRVKFKILPEHISGHG